MAAVLHYSINADFPHLHFFYEMFNFGRFRPLSRPHPLQTTVSPASARLLYKTEDFVKWGKTQYLPACCNAVNEFVGGRGLYMFIPRFTDVPEEFSFLSPHLNRKSQRVHLRPCIGNFHELAADQTTAWLSKFQVYFFLMKVFPLNRYLLVFFLAFSLSGREPFFITISSRRSSFPSPSRSGNLKVTSFAVHSS
ncbi:MAG: hypothetical protein A4E60_01961 [Syntrophorhabdus sp. PtaB.Bin047]|nr:MAG: hypothetical protein A4E60_01961 [Syntrophorhabdus sp. PtaB.Bin047]